MIALRDVCYVRLGTTDLGEAERFATAILGLEVAERRRGALYLRSDQRAHTLCYVEGDPAAQVTGFEVADEAALEGAAAALDALGHAVNAGTPAECEARRVRAFIGFRDPTGNAIELAVRPAHAGGRYAAARGTARSCGAPGSPASAARRRCGPRRGRCRPWSRSARRAPRPWSRGRCGRSR